MATLSNLVNPPFPQTRPFIYYPTIAKGNIYAITLPTPIFLIPKIPDVSILVLLAKKVFSASIKNKIHIT